MDTVPAYVDWRVCTATPLSEVSWLLGSSKTPATGSVDRIGTVAKFLVPDREGRIQLGLSYRPARLHWLTGRYDNIPESTISPSQGLRIGPLYSADPCAIGGFIKGILRGVRCTKSWRVLFLHRRPPPGPLLYCTQEQYSSSMNPPYGSRVTAVPTLYHTYCTSVPRYRKPSEATLYCMAATMMFCSDASILEHEKNAILENWRRIHTHTVSLRFLGKILTALRLEVFLYNVYITNQFQTQGGGKKNPSEEMTVNSKEENSIKLLSQLRPRIRPLDCFTWLQEHKKEIYGTVQNNLD